MGSGIPVINVGLIGYGYWGKTIHSKLEKISNVRFVCRSKDTYVDKLDSVDWVFVVTPDVTHYEIVKTCIQNGKNVFCEKPFTADFNQALSLYRLAEVNNIKLYVDDVFNYRNELKDLHNIIDTKKEIKVIWNTLKIQNYLNRLTWHHLYMLYPILNGKLDIQWPRINNIIFDYEVKDIKCHKIAGIDFTHNSHSNDALFDMVNGVLNDDTMIDWDYNKEITLNSEKILERIR